jgi:hypothetical protein
MLGTLDENFKNLRCTFQSTYNVHCILGPSYIFFGFLLLDSAVGKEPWPDVLSAIANTLYHSPVSGD